MAALRELESVAYIEKMNPRKNYLVNSWGNVANTLINILKWPVDIHNPPKVVSLFITKTDYW